MIYIGSNFDRELDAQKHLIDVHSRSENDIREQIVALETALSSYADKHGRQVKLIQAKAQEQMDKNEEKHQQQMVADSRECYRPAHLRGRSSGAAKGAVRRGSADQAAAEVQAMAD